MRVCYFFANALEKRCCLQPRRVNCGFCLACPLPTAGTAGAGAARAAAQCEQQGAAGRAARRASAHAVQAVGASSACPLLSTSISLQFIPCNFCVLRKASDMFEQGAWGSTHSECTDGNRRRDVAVTWPAAE